MEDNWQQLASVVAVVGAGLVTLRYLWKTVPKLYKRFMQGMFGIGSLKLDIASLSDKVSFLVSEMHPNGGTSIRDALDRIEEQLSLTSERSRGRWLDAPELLFETTPDGDCIWVNRTYMRESQRSMSELMGRGWVTSIAAEDRDSVVEAWYKSVEEDREFVMSYKLQTPDGKTFPVIGRSYKMVNHRGDPIGYLGQCELV